MIEKLHHNNYSCFRSNVCHYIKNHGELTFIKEIILDNTVEKYIFKENNHLYGIYILAMLDYLCRKNDIDTYNKYDYLRNKKFDKPIYSFDVLLMSNIQKNNKAKESALKHAIPEFLRHNIIEG